MTPGRLLQALMTERGLNQSRLANRMKELQAAGQWEHATVSQATIGRISNDKPSGEVKRPTLQALAAYFGVPDPEAFASGDASEVEAVRRGMIPDDTPGPGAATLSVHTDQAHLDVMKAAAASGSGAVLLGSALAIEIDKISDAKIRERAFLAAMVAIRRTGGFP
jgi:transcriptional regulator with XRE-family HTH domain